MLNGQVPQFANSGFEESSCDIDDCNNGNQISCVNNWWFFEEYLPAPIFDDSPWFNYECHGVQCSGFGKRGFSLSTISGIVGFQHNYVTTNNPFYNYNPENPTIYALNFDAINLSSGGGGYLWGIGMNMPNSFDPEVTPSSVGTLLLKSESISDEMDDCSASFGLLNQNVSNFPYMTFAIHSNSNFPFESHGAPETGVFDNLSPCAVLEFSPMEGNKGCAADNNVCLKVKYDVGCLDLESCIDDPDHDQNNILEVSLFDPNGDVLFYGNHYAIENGEMDICFPAATDVDGEFIEGDYVFSVNFVYRNCTDYAIPTVTSPYYNTYEINVPVNFETHYCSKVIEIASNTTETWTPANTGDNGYLKSGDIIVRSGATLTIDDGVEIAFCEGASLIIEPNATVNLYGHLIACDDLWQGVDVYGLQSATTQWVQGGIRPVGKLKMYPKSLIKNAVVAVDLSSANGAGGGILQAEEAFIEDFYHTGVHFVPFENHNPYTGNIAPNFSYMHGCRLTEHETFEPSGFPLSMVHLEGVRGVSIKGCRFENKRTSAPSNFFGVGIYSQNSNFVATYLCNDAGPSTEPCTDYTRNYFKGLSFGIHNSQNDLQEDKGFIVRESEFHQCNFGIYNLNASYGRIVNNDFYLGDGKGLLTIHQFGTFFRGEQSGFTLEANNFLLDEVVNNDNTIGSLCQSIGETNNYVRINTYDGLLYGNLSNGKNFMDMDVNVGLVYHCNENNNGAAYSDFAVTDEGIRKKQALIVRKEPLYIAEYYPAGNYFTHANLSFSDFNNNNDMDEDGSRHIDYYHADAAHGVPEEIPESYTEGTITLIDRDEPRECATKYISPGTPQEEIDIPEVTDDFEDHQGEWNIKRALYCAKITAGGSNALLEKVAKATQSPAALKADLMMASPYVSLEILSATLNSTQLNTADKMEVLLANPHAGYTPTFFAESGLTTAQIAEIKAAMASESDRSVSELDIGYHRQQMDESSTLVMQEVLNDPQEMTADFVSDWYQQLATPTTDYKQAAQYVNAGNYTEANDLLAAMSTQYCGWDTESVLHQEMEDYIDLLIQLHQTGLSPKEMPKPLLADFYDLVENATTSVRHKAEAIYASATGEDFFLDYTLPGGAQGLAREAGADKAEVEERQVKLLSEQVMVYPNPASDVVHFMNLEGASHLSIKDITGRTILNMDSNETDYQWKTTNVSNGVYFYTVFNDDTVIATGKVVINK